ncbi:sortase [Curtobacterium flaccumfaciens]|nr:sortase [Curtobacterium flaccumfaciens]
MGTAAWSSRGSGRRRSGRLGRVRWGGGRGHRRRRRPGHEIGLVERVVLTRDSRRQRHEGVPGPGSARSPFRRHPGPRDDPGDRYLVVARGPPPRRRRRARPAEGLGQRRLVQRRHRPGQVGPAVIAGHVDSPTAAAVFFRLDELVPGDEIHVAMSDGSTRTFTVDRSEHAAKSAFPTSDVYGTAPTPQLRLITCDGTFDTATGHYTDNLIVFADLSSD